MSKNGSAFFIGLIFGLGLVIAQMANPAKVLAFLDVAGEWDASLALVMASALLTLAVLQRVIDRFRKPGQEPAQSVCGTPKTGIDAELIGGAAIFGIGWGLSGICPGPALVGLASGLIGNYVFVAALFAGFILFKLLHHR